MKRISSFLASLGLALTLFLGAMPVKATADSVNLIANPSVETADSSNQPTGWLQGKWGTNTTTFSYQNTGHTGNKSVYVSMTRHSSGDAKWYFSNVPVTPGQQYTFSDYYKSNVVTEVDAQFTDTSGNVSYAFMGNPAASATNWNASTDTFTVPANIKSMTVFHVINKVGWLQTDDYSLTAVNSLPPPTPTPPTVSFAQPAANATVSGTQTISANASDTIGMANVQFQIDGVNFGNPVTASPYSTSWNSNSVTNGSHTISVIATDTSGLTSTVSETVNVQNVVATPPSVSLTAPTNNFTVNGTASISANASDASGNVSVQFKLDGNNLGNPISSAPYTYSWNTTTVSDGSHTLTAVATNAAGLSTTSSPVVVSVQNTISPPPSNNLILNPSVETAQNATTPQGWSGGGWGSNTTTASYLNTGHTGQRSVELQVSNYSNGAAEWYYNEVPVTGGQTYSFSDWYQSNVNTEVDAEVTVNGVKQYYFVGNVLANTSWTNYTTTFTAPAGATSMTLFHLIAGSGYLITDDYSLTPYIPVPFNRGIVSITFDDGWANQYTNALPLLQANGQSATFYIISGSLTDQPNYMTGTQVKNLYKDGMEIGSHTVTHPDLTTVSQSKLVNEMSQSQTTLQNLIGAPVTDFAYPYGSYNANTIAVGLQYYQSQRTVDRGLNTKQNFDPTKLMIQEVDSDITPAQVQGWVNDAIQQKAWLILVYHQVSATPTDPSNDLYNTQVADLSSELGYIKQSGVAVETVHQALLETESQL